MARITYLQIGGHTEAAKKTRALWRVLDNRREELRYLGWVIVRRRGRWLHKGMKTHRYRGTDFGSLLPPWPAAAAFRSILFVSGHEHWHAAVFEEQRCDGLPAEAH
jgi:hypothetical protein